MSKNKILITGARGLLGSNLALMYSPNYDVIATGVNKPNFPFCRNLRVDITQESDLEIISRENPDMVVNCAAHVNADYCYEHPEDARQLNLSAAINLAKVCKDLGSYFIQLSTDAVFDGEKGDYSETDTARPIHLYGETKLKAEELIQKIGGHYVIIRTTLYGWNHQDKLSLSEWIINQLKRKEKVTAFTDLFFTPISVTNLGRAISELYKKSYQGVIHLGGSEKISKFDFAKRLAKTFGEDESFIIPFNSENFGFKTKRPKDLSLSTERAKGILRTKLLSVDEGLEELKLLKESGYVNKLKQIV